MAIGEKLRQARLDAGISQRALCGDRITRNMLSQIENGSARPSMQTLTFLAEQLGKPVSFFLEEAPVQTQESPLAQGISLLEQARSLLNAGRKAEAAQLLTQAEAFWEAAPDWVRRQAVLLRAHLDPEAAAKQVDRLPSLDGELQLRAQAALAAQDPQRCISLLFAAEDRDALWNLTMGEALLLQKKYAEAAHYFHQAETDFPHRSSQTLEICYRELEDYQKAYHYACRVRNLGGK